METTLGEMLQSSTETATTVDAAPDLAQIEQPVSVDDQSAKVDVPVEEQVTEQPEQPKTEETEKTPEQLAEAKREQDFGELRQHKVTLEKELSEIRQKVEQFGGESHLQIMQPLLKQAAEIPRTDADLETWSEKTWEVAKSSFLPAQLDGLKTEAAWEYLRDPRGQQVVCNALYGEGVTPAVIKEFVDAYKADATILDLLRPDEDADQKAYRLAQEEKEQASQKRMEQLELQLKGQEESNQKQQVQQILTKTAEVGFAPRAEVKKQFGLEFHKNGDTPEIASFKQRVDARYEQITTLRLMNDPQLNHLWSTAEYLASQKDDAQRQRINGQYTPQIQERTRAVCAEVAKELAEDLKLLSPGLSDQSKVQDLKDLPANIAGNGAAKTSSTSYDLSDMPDATANPRAYEAWVSKRMMEDSQRRNTPGVLQAG